MTEREQLEQAMAAFEAQRDALGDAAVDAALEGLRQKLAALAEADAAAPVAEAVPEQAQDSRLAGERKLVTVMFADLSGFTALSEKLDPEQARDLANACFARLVPVVERYGGTVARFLGDAILALFGAPRAHENDPERALRAALEMMEALAEFNAQQGLELGQALALHIGINTGLAVAGDLGSGERAEYSAMGDAVNVAARLEDLSQRGEVLVGPDTYRATAPLFEFEALRPVRVKGKAGPLPVYRLVGLRAEPERVRGLEPRGLSSPLVGRDAELAAIRGCVERLLEGEGGIVSVIGEAGVGKSRLMAELRASVGATRDQGRAHGGDSDFRSLPRLRKSGNELVWLEGRALSYGQTISYWPFQEILWGYAGISEEDSEAEAWQKLERAVAALFPEETAEILPYLASLLSLEVREPYSERVRYLDGEAMGHQVYLASWRTFERLAQQRTLVLVFEDLHWCDESSALLIEHLLPLVQRVPLLIVGLSRPYRQTPAARLRDVAARDFAARYTEIELTPLSQPASAQLVSNLLQIEDLSPRARGAIVAKAGGNPFFLEEIIRALIDAGAVVRDAATGRWRATAQIERVAIPDTVQGVIVARVDRLDRDVKRVLRTASVIGRSFLYRVLDAVEEAGRQLDGHLAELQEIELIREVQRLPELEYIFKHALAQEATYESILLQRRRELHARVGGAIEALFDGRLEEFYGLLAYHYARAEAWEKALEYLLKAGDQAGRVAADAEALAHYRQAMAAYAHAFGEEWDPLQRAALERKMGEAQFRQGEHAQAVEHLERALEYLGQPVPATRWRLRLAIVREIAVQIAHRLFSRWLVKAIGGPVDAVAVEAVSCFEPLGWIEVMMNADRFLYVTLRTLNLSEHSGYGHGIVEASAGFGIILQFLGFLKLAGGYGQRSLKIGETIQDSIGLSFAYFGLAMLRLSEGDLQGGITFADKSAQIGRRENDLRQWGMGQNLVSACLLYQGRLAECASAVRDMLQAGQEGGDKTVECWGLSKKGHQLWKTGQLDEAVTSLEACVKLAEAIPDLKFRVEAGAGLGRSLLRLGKLDQALSVLEDACELNRRNPQGGGMREGLAVSVAEAYVAAAEQSAPEERKTWLRKARRACRDAMKASWTARHRKPEVLLLRGRLAWITNRPAAAVRDWQRSLALAEAARQQFDLGRVHLEMGRRLGDREHLERAEAILAGIGAELDLGRAREALEEMRAD